MKNTVCIFLLFTFGTNPLIGQQITGAWHKQQGTAETILILQSNYFTITTFDKVNKKFKESWGGAYIQNNGSIAATIEFHSSDKQLVGKKISFKAAVRDNILDADILPGNKKWQHADAAPTTVTGLWVITGREQNGTMNIITPGERKTIKMLTGKRFQWAAINTGTGEFLGTGGGTYTFENDIYTENIEFFSRDSTRVGRSLTFRGYVNEGKWDHSGRSSKGDPVHEIWTKLQ